MLMRKLKDMLEGVPLLSGRAGFAPELLRLESKVKESPCAGVAGQDSQRVWAASFCCRQQLCSLIDLPYALPLIPIDGEEVIILCEHFAKIFSLEFLERQLDSSKYSFKSPWSICYGVSVISQGGGVAFNN